MSCSLFRSPFRYSPCHSETLNNVIIVCIGVSASPQKYYAPLSFQAPLKSANCWSPLLRQFPLYIGSLWTAPQPKNRIFQWTPIIFLVKISQSKFLVMTEKDIFVYKLFLSLIISDTNLFFMWKLHPSFPSTPFWRLRSWDPVKQPLFWGSHTRPPSRKRCFYSSFQTFPWGIKLKHWLKMV